jgi:hypothetical protein
MEVSPAARWFPRNGPVGDLFGALSVDTEWFGELWIGFDNF